MKKTIYIVFIVLSVILIAALCIWFVLWRLDTVAAPSVYLTQERYAKELGIPNIPCTFKSFKQYKGEIPDQQICTDADSFIVTLDDVDYCFYDSEYLNSLPSETYDDYVLMKVVIRNPEFCFGPARVRIGCTRDAVDRIYRKHLTCYECPGEGGRIH